MKWKEKEWIDNRSKGRKTKEKIVLEKVKLAKSLRNRKVEQITNVEHYLCVTKNEDPREN